MNRRELIERYLSYDAKKKKKQVPDMTNWDWNDPNSLDAELEKAGFKHGIITGFRTWRSVTLNSIQLAKCAIVNSIFSSSERALGQLVTHERFDSWQPDRPTDWYDTINQGQPFDPNWFVILRPAVSSESPARWYVEDGSGRALAFFRHLNRRNDTSSTLPAYLGSDPDSTSIFMQKEFKELLPPLPNAVTADTLSRADRGEELEHFSSPTNLYVSWDS